MRIILSGGGTAGHINPALALAEVLKSQGHEVLFAGTPNGVEARLVGKTDIPFTPFEAAGFDREKPWTLVTSSLKILGSIGKAKKWMRSIRPDAVVGFGGYVSIPVGTAASQLGIPLVVHEQNSVMGMANKFLGKRAKAVALTYDVAAKDVEDRSKVVVTGNPVRSSMLSATREEGRAMLNVPEDALMLLVFGGSLGAKHINERICSLKDDLLGRDNLYVVHIAGPKQYDACRELLNLTDEEAKRWILIPYQDRMAETLAATDCIVSRAGATSLAEISALRIPSLLVPFPFAAEDHQTTNAKSYVECGAAYMIADADLDSQDFVDKLHSLIDDPAVRASMAQAAAELKTEDASANLAEVVIRAAQAR